MLSHYIVIKTPYNAPDDPRAVFVSVYDRASSPRPSEWPLRLSRPCTVTDADALIADLAQCAASVEVITYDE